MTGYHLAQKMIPAAVNPYASLTVTYAVALVASLAVLALWPGNGPAVAALRQVNWVSAALGIVIVALELGGLLAYRRGWDVSTFGLVFNVLAALILLPVGILFFRERLSAVNWTGVGLCVAGLLLMAKR
jgi:uncharacterized membrane protein